MLTTRCARITPSTGSRWPLTLLPRVLTATGNAVSSYYRFFSCLLVMSGGDCTGVRARCGWCAIRDRGNSQDAYQARHQGERPESVSMFAVRGAH